jgi:hypothetical protein
MKVSLTVTKEDLLDFNITLPDLRTTVITNLSRLSAGLPTITECTVTLDEAPVDRSHYRVVLKP